MEPISPISSTPIILLPVGGSAGVITGALYAGAVGVRLSYPTQLLGFVPLVSCTLSECREFVGNCYLNPVFGDLNVSGSTYENDLNTFFIHDSMRRVTNFNIEKLNTITKQWDDVARVGSSLPALYPFVTTYGTFYKYNFFSAQPNYIGYQINWGYVLTNNGTGVYRLKIESPAIVDTKPKPSPYCLVSEPFQLFGWDCNRAHGTVKFEAYQSGKVGSIDTDGYIFDICNIRLFDSIRQKGFFGYEKTGFDEILLEYQTGLIDRVRDEALQKFTFFSKMMPKYIHDRFKSYGMMSDLLYVSDYNLNNSDYSIKKKNIVKAGGFEPTYHVGTRLSSVKVEFAEGIQSVIKSSSCIARQ